MYIPSVHGVYVVSHIYTLHVYVFFTASKYQHTNDTIYVKSLPDNVCKLDEGQKVRVAI